MQLLTATVKSQPREVSTKFGQRSVMDVTLPNGQEQAIWGPANFPAIINCRNGQNVPIAVDSKGKYHVVEGQTAPAVTAQPTQTAAANAYSLDPDTKKAIAEYLKQQKDLLQFCWQQAETIEGPQTEDSIEKLAVTLYLSAQRKFGLA